jgi:hypothetical protein
LWSTRAKKDYSSSSLFFSDRSIHHIASIRFSHPYPSQCSSCWSWAKYHHPHSPIPTRRPTALMPPLPPLRRRSPPTKPPPCTTSSRSRSGSGRMPTTTMSSQGSSSAGCSPSQRSNLSFLSLSCFLLTLSINQSIAPFVCFNITHITCHTCRFLIMSPSRSPLSSRSC